MDLARRFLLKAGEAVDKLNQTEVIALRNGLIRAHKELTAPRAECPKCNEVDVPVHQLM
jgi:hypothetical protein